MPLSFATRLRGVLVAVALVIGLAFAEFDRKDIVTMGIFVAMPFLIWMLASSAVKDAPPFDDSAFHRTRPITPGQTFRRLAGFHLLPLAVVVAIIVAYGWHCNLAAWEIAIGALSVVIPWIALVSLFSTIASLTTSNSHSKAWGPLAGLLVPSLSTVVLCWVAFKRTRLYGYPAPISFPSYQEMAVAAAVVYPLLWWVVSARRVWRLGCALALLVGCSLPLIFSMIKVGDPFPYYPPSRIPFEELKMQRISTATVGHAPDPDQVFVSQLMTVEGLAPDEFIAGLQLRRGRPGEIFKSDEVLTGMNGTAFSTDSAGRMIPATASLFHAMGLKPEDETEFPVWGWDRDRWENDPLGKRRLLRDFLGLRVRPSANFSLAQSPVSPKSSLLTWELRGSRYQWVKVLEVSAGKTGRADLPGGGIIEVIPPKESSSYPQLLLQIIRGIRTSPPWSNPNPVIIARTADERAALVPLSSGGYFNAHNGFLTSRTIFSCPEERLTPQQVADLKNARLEVYWPAYRSSFESMLPPPE